MKARTALMTGVALACFGVAWAQTPGRVPTLLDFQAELGLSEQQRQKISVEVKAFEEGQEAGNKGLAEAEAKVASLLTSRAEVADIRQAVTLAEELRSQVRYQDVVTSRRVMSLLSKQQQDRWREIQQRSRKKP